MQPANLHTRHNAGTSGALGDEGASLTTFFCCSSRIAPT